MPLCITYWTFQGSVHVWNASSRNHYADKYHVYQVSLFPLVPLPSCCTAHRGATVLVLKKRRQARLALSSSQPRPGSAQIWSGCCHAVAVRPHGSFQNRMLKGKIPPKKQLCSFPTSGIHSKEPWRCQVKKMFTLRSVQGAAFVNFLSNCDL